MLPSSPAQPRLPSSTRPPCWMAAPMPVPIMTTAVSTFGSAAVSWCRAALTSLISRTRPAREARSSAFRPCRAGSTSDSRSSWSPITSPGRAMPMRSTGSPRSWMNAARACFSCAGVKSGPVATLRLRGLPGSPASMSSLVPPTSTPSTAMVRLLVRGRGLMRPQARGNDAGRQGSAARPRWRCSMARSARLDRGHSARWISQSLSTTCASSSATWIAAWLAKAWRA